MPRRQHKYRAQPTKVDGIRFDSKAEARRYGELKMLQQANEIADLEIQPKFSIDVNGKHICDYIADFRYRNVRYDQGVVVEDVKSEPVRKNRAYRLKVKLMAAVHGISITEVPA